MDYQDMIVKAVERALGKDRAYLQYVLLSDTGQGELHVDGETLRVPAYSFTEMSDIVRNEFEKIILSAKFVPIGLRGERYISDRKELERCPHYMR